MYEILKQLEIFKSIFVIAFTEPLNDQIRVK